MSRSVCVVVTARNEAERLAATLDALAEGFPGAAVVVADDGSEDGTAEIARGAGALVESAPAPQGKGGTATLGAERALAGGAEVIVLCDGDLGESALALPALVTALGERRADMTVAAFTRREGGGFGIALGFAHWAIRRLSGFDATAPISGQRALTAEALRAALPFAPRFGMEIGMTVDVVRAGLRIEEVELDLAHRATGRTAAGFRHRFRQLRDFARVYVSRARSGGRRPERGRDGA